VTARTEKRNADRPPKPPKDSKIKAEKTKTKPDRVKPDKTKTSRKSESKTPTTRSPRPIVRVSFHESIEDPGFRNPDNMSGYSYLWPLESTPTVGDRVRVPGMDGLASAEVIGFGLDPGISRSQLKSVSRLTMSADDARARDQAYIDAWLDSACRVVGLPPKTRLRKRPREYYPDPPPVDGTASPKQAGEYGRVWWKIAKNARDKDEEQAFYKAAKHWYKIADASRNDTI